MSLMLAVSFFFFQGWFHRLLFHVGLTASELLRLEYKAVRRRVASKTTDIAREAL
jgi:hypothetical protein